MDIKAEAIDGAGKLLMDHQLWSDVKYFVQDVDGQSGLTGPDKKAKVKADLILIFGEVGSVLLSMAIELGVLWLQSQSTK
jgi:hypothetical protein